jgi:DNA ligase-1
VSQLIDARSFEELEDLRLNARDASIEGIMLKRRDSAYVAGRRTGLWYKWKRDPLTADCVLMYAQRGSGKRSSYYSDYTFGCWTTDGQLLPVGKAYFGFTDEELRWLDRLPEPRWAYISTQSAVSGSRFHLYQSPVRRPAT